MLRRSAMLGHWRVRRLLEAYSEGALPKRPADQVEGHIAACSACARELAALVETNSLLRSACPPAQAPCAAVDDAVLRAALAAVASPNRARVGARRVLAFMAASIVVLAMLGWAMGRSPHGEPPAIARAEALKPPVSARTGGPATAASSRMSTLTTTVRVEPAALPQRRQAAGERRASGAGATAGGSAVMAAAESRAPDVLLRVMSSIVTSDAPGYARAVAFLPSRSGAALRRECAIGTGGRGSTSWRKETLSGGGAEDLVVTVTTMAEPVVEDPPAGESE